MCLILVKEARPVGFIIVTRFRKMWQIWENVDHLREGRLDNEVDETDLALRNISCLSVEELADREAMHLLKVSLSEELNKE